MKDGLPVRCDNEVSKDERDEFLIDKLTSPMELSGMLNYALEGLQRILDNGCFSFDKTPDEIKLLMNRNSNPLCAFVQDILIENNGVKITKEDMFAIYSMWCKTKNKARLSKEQLGRQLSKHANYILAKRSKHRYWENASLKPFINNTNSTLDTFLQTYKDVIKMYNI